MIFISVLVLAVGWIAQVEKLDQNNTNATSDCHVREREQPPSCVYHCPKCFKIRRMPTVTTTEPAAAVNIAS